MKKKIIAMMLSIMTLSQLGAKEANASTNFSWTVQTGTALHETDSNWKFLLGDYNKDKIDDLYCINKSKKEIHTIKSSDNIRFRFTQPEPFCIIFLFFHILSLLNKKKRRKYEKPIWKTEHSLQ